MIKPFGEIQRTLGALVVLLDRAALWKIGGLMALGVLNMLVEVGALLTFVILMFHFGDPTFHVGENGATRFLADTLPGFGIGIPQLIIILFLAYLGKNLLRLAELYAREVIAEQVGAQYANKLFTQYLLAPLPLHLERGPSEMIDTVWHTSDEALRGTLTALLSLIADLLVAFGICFVLFRTSPGAAFLLVGGIGLLSLALLVAMHDHFGRIGQRFRHCHVAALQVLQQAFRGIREVKLFQKEAAFARQFGTLRQTLRQLVVGNGIYQFVPALTLEMIFVTSFAVLAFHAHSTVESEWVLPIVGVFAFCGLRLLPSAHRILRSINDMRSRGPVLEYLCQELLASADCPQADRSSEPLLPPHAAITLRRVSFQYRGTEGCQLVEVDLHFAPGKTYAIMGESGSGKTTLLHVIAGLLEPSDGAVFIGSRPLCDCLHAWQKRVGYVAQDPFLLSGSITENITLDKNKPDIARLQQAISAAQLADWVQALPQKWETVIGEGGRRISGGEKQRIAIARALFKNPSVLLLDEPTSALDTITERALEQALLRLDGQVTRILITHRLATARNCDQIVFLNEGCVAACGTYNDLIASCPSFRQFAEG